MPPQAARTAEAEAQFEWSAQEMENHGEIRGLIEKEAARVAYQTEQRLRAEYEQKLQDTTSGATDPLKQELEQTKQQLQSQQQYNESYFNNSLASEVKRMGLPNINDLVTLPEFQERFSQVDPGDDLAWGDKLKGNITGHKLPQSVAMLEDFVTRYPHLVEKSQDNATVPQATAPRAAPTPSSAKLTKREELTELLRKRQEDFVRGVSQWPKDKYIVEQQKLRDQIDALPTT